MLANFVCALRQKHRSDHPNQRQDQACDQHGDETTPGIGVGRSLLGNAMRSVSHEVILPAVAMSRGEAWQTSFLFQLDLDQVPAL